MPRLKGPPQKGDLVEIHWLDILDSPGDPDTASLAKRISIGIFWAEKMDGDIPAIVTTTTIDSKDITGQTGFCIYPKSCVTKINIIRRGKKEKNGTKV